MGDTHGTVAVATADPGAFNEDWTENDMLAFNKVLIDEALVYCQWVDYETCCGERVKGKDFKVHLPERHGITDDLQPYRCLWYGCSSKPMKRTSLERHMRERHVPVKWACPHCMDTFTRDTTLTKHIAQRHQA